MPARTPSEIVERVGLVTFPSAQVRRHLVMVFLLLFLLPIRPEIGGLRFDPYRGFLLLFVPAFLPGFLSGRFVRFRFADAMMLCFAFWIVVTLAVHHGLERVPYGFIQAMDFLGGYLVARICIRSAEDFRRFLSVFLVVLVLLSPFAVTEFLTGRAPLNEFFGRFLPTIPVLGAERYGFTRVQAVFPHSILFGIFCSIGLAGVIYPWGTSKFMKTVGTSLVLGMTALSLSSAALLACAMQIGLVTWGWLTRRRWKPLIWLVIGCFVFLEIASNRGPIIILIETITFDPQTGWWRIYIWEYGSQSVLRYPVFGIGLNDWERPAWLTASSVDNFWLLVSMRHGLVGGMFVALTVGTTIVAVARRTVPEDLIDIKTGYLIGCTALVLTLCTVHVWDALAAFVMFYFGAGAFLREVDPVTPEKAQHDLVHPALTGSGPSFTRFPATARRPHRNDA